MVCGLVQKTGQLVPRAEPLGRGLGLMAGSRFPIVLSECSRIVTASNGVGSWLHGGMGGTQVQSIHQHSHERLRIPIGWVPQVALLAFTLQLHGGKCFMLGYLGADPPNAHEKFQRVNWANVVQTWIVPYFNVVALFPIVSKHTTRPHISVQCAHVWTRGGRACGLQPSPSLSQC